MQVSRTSIASDIACIRSQAKETIKEYTTEYLPEQYRVCLSALDTILKHAYEILQTSHDNREKLQAMDLFKDTHLVKLGLLSNATTIDNALHYIRTKQQQKGLVWILLVVTTAIVVMVISFPSIITCNELVSYL